MLIESCCFWRVTLTRDTWHVGVTRSRMRAHAHCAVTHTLSEFCLENFQAEFRLTVFLAWFHAECVHCVSLAAYTFCHRVCHCACVCLVFWMRFCVQEAVTCRFELVRRHHTYTALSWLLSRCFHFSFIKQQQTRATYFVEIVEFRVLVPADGTSSLHFEWEVTTFNDCQIVLTTKRVECAQNQNLLNI